MDTTQILKTGRQIWGPDRQSLEHVLACLVKINGDIAAQVRNKHENGSVNTSELQKEFGNLVVSSLRWMDDLGFDIEKCLKLALDSQQAYKDKQEGKS